MFHLLRAGKAAGPAETVNASRRAVLRHSAVFAGATAAAGALLSTPQSAQADMRARSRGQGQFFRSILKHEQDHVDFLKEALGEAARPKPTFRNLTPANTFGGFAVVAQTLENVGVGAYLGAAPFISSMDILAAAGSIATIEARHAGYLNSLHGDPLTDDARPGDTDNSFEPPLTAAQVVELAAPFIADLNGGPPVGYDDVQTDANDIDILNFALALEYLEREFYEVNVPRFFR